MPGLLERFRSLRRDVMAESRVAETLEQLVAAGELSPAAAERLARTLQETGHESRYVMGHLCAHLAIGLVFSFDLVPLPLGTLARGAWVVGNRVYAISCGDRRRASVHSVPVLLMSLIPFAGYFAYLIPLRATNADAAYLYANHIAYLRNGCSLEQMLQRRPVWMQRLLRGLLASVMEKPAEEGRAEGPDSLPPDASPSPPDSP